MSDHSTTRRQFVKGSAASLAAAGAAAQLGISAVAHAGAADTIKVGLIGCGGRGTGAANQALSADPGVKLVAMGDAFGDMLESSLKTLMRSGNGARIDVPAERRFVGFDAYKHVTDAVDVVLLCSTPHFRPQHLQYAVDKGKHIFCEKPVATDGPGVRACLKASEEAEAKKLNLVSGLCWRYHQPKVQTLNKVLEGAIGDIVSIETVYNAHGVWAPRVRREQTKSEMEYQMRNWYYYTWLSGDHICEQAIHSLDKMGWVMNDEPPLRCWGVGGRQARTGEKWGNIYDHFSIVYEYPNNVRGYHTCRHWPGSDSRVLDYIMGTKGVCDVFGHRYTAGDTKWRYRGKENDMYQTEHDELFAAIRAGKVINNGKYMCRSTLLSIMGRMAAYTGQVISWEAALNSTENLSPEKYDWIDIPRPEVAIPGVTKFA